MKIGKITKIIGIIKNVKKTTPSRPTTPAEEGAVQNIPIPRIFFPVCTPTLQTTVCDHRSRGCPRENFSSPPKTISARYQIWLQNLPEIIFSRDDYFFQENIFQKFPHAAQKCWKSGKMDFHGILEHLPGENKYRLE